MNKPLTKRDIAAANRYYQDSCSFMREGKPVQAPVHVPKARAAPNPRPRSSEHAEQCAVVHWWRYACGGFGLPMFALYAVPNGAFLAGTPNQRGMQMNKLKAEGLRPGIPDFVLAKPVRLFHGLYVEMKYGDNKPSLEQNQVMAYLLSVGYRCAVCWSADQAIDEIRGYLT